MSGQRAFGPWLKQRRRELDLTQEELARRVGCARATIRKLEANRRRPSKTLLERLAQALDIAPEQRPLFLQLARTTGDDVPLQLPLEPASIHTPLYNLPAPLTPLIGREAEIASIRERLLQPGVRLVTLIGPPGIGKTRLSLQLAEKVRGAFPHGIVFVALATITDPERFPLALARTLGIQESGQPVLESLKDFLRHRQMLMVLDNFEQIVEAALVISDLLTASAGLKVVVSSRVALRLYAEHKFPVPPLLTPDLHEPLNLSQLAQTPAVALFLQRAKAVTPRAID